MAAAALLLSSCWNWIPEEPAPAGPSPAEASPPAANPSGASSGSRSRGATPGGATSGAIDWYTVKAGDTLFSIAWRHRVQVKDLAAWNSLGDGSLILVGQRIRLTSPSARASSATPATPPGGAAPVSRTGQWKWPTGGRLDAKGARARAGDYGIRILGKRGQEIVAADGGYVMYAGDGLKAYGLLVIVQHSPEWLSAYGHIEKILVNEGDEVRPGQPIATMGMGPGNAAMLHFEIRRDGKPVEPVRLLPPRG